MATKLLNAYVEWVRRNVDNIPSVERLGQMLTIILADPSNLVGRELGTTLTNIHSFSNEMIISSAGRQLCAAEQMAIASKVIQKVECLLELLLRRYSTHRTAWNILLIIQLVKCCLNMLTHKQMFLVPSICVALRQQIRGMLAYLRKILSHELDTRNQLGGEGVAVPQNSSAVGKCGTPLVIPRVAAHRMYKNFNPTHKESHNNTSTGLKGTTNVSSGAEVLPCTAVDLLGVAVDFVLLLRPLFLVHCAKSVFPKNMMYTHLASGTGGGSATATHAVGGVVDHGNFFVVKTLMTNGAKSSTLSNWSVWTMFLGLDAILALLARYIQRHRVPVVYINTEPKSNRGSSYDLDKITSLGGEVPSRDDDVSGVAEAKDNSMGDNETSHPHAADAVPPAPVLSRDSLRVQQTMYNLVLCFFRDPFFGAVLRKFIYDNFVIGWINRVPLLGSLLALQVASFLCRQHYCFTYSIGE
uniref:Peroxisomal membrane protein PEX16 n=1 Tax=Trypanosoma congolense (strain IL3000) TaxID=1068625 RepID=G0UTW1_TRYCI|nr:conserved hypothetical protein [Trypanosoma congolense IL3000]